jgi:UDP-N-acetylmuramyl tripeptide synthase
VMNALAAIAVARVYGIPPEQAAKRWHWAR